MTIEELELLKKDNASKAKQILEAEDGVVEDAQKLINENNKINEKIEALKSVKDQLLPVEEAETEVKDTKAMSKIEFRVNSSYDNLPFDGNREEKALTAYAWGKLAQSLRGDQSAQKWLSEKGYYGKAVAENVNASGGFLVPDLLADSIIRLRETFGVCRKYADYRVMGSDTLLVPKNTQSPTAYWVGDNTTITESSPVFAQASVLAKKLAILSQVSSEVNEDSIISVGTHLATDFAWKIESEIDRCMMVGSSANATDGNTDGFITANLGVASNVGTVAAATGTAANWQSVTRANLRTVVSRLPQYADIPGQVAWFMTREFYNDVVCNILDGLSGNSAMDIAAFGAGTPTLFGYPIVFSQNLTKTAAGTNNAPLCAFGNLKTGFIYGERRGMDIRTSDHFYFNQDALAVRGTVRVGWNAHDPGTSSAAGSIIVLKRTT